MFRFPSRSSVVVLMFALSILMSGCMYQQPMYQPGYGQQMYGAPGNYAAPGTMVIPPSNAPAYAPGSNSTYDSNTSSGTTPEPAKDERFFREDGAPLPKDPASGTGGEKFNSEFPSGT